MSDDNQYRQFNASQANAAPTTAPAIPSAPAAVAEAPAVPSPTDLARQERLAKCAKSYRSGAKWILAIAVLSVVNVVMVATQSERVFVAGLSVNQMVQFITNEMEAPIIGIVFSLITSAAFAMLAIFAFRRATWALITALVLYLLDSLLMLGLAVLGGEMGSAALSLVIHVLALVYIGKAIAAVVELRRLEAGASAPV